MLLTVCLLASTDREGKKVNKRVDEAFVKQLVGRAVHLYADDGHLEYKSKSLTRTQLTEMSEFRDADSVIVTTSKRDGKKQQKGSFSLPELKELCVANNKNFLLTVAKGKPGPNTYRLIVERVK